MWKMKSCPKCSGDMFVDYDEDGMFNHCLQCGYVGDIEPIEITSEIPAVRKHSVSTNYR